MRTLRRILAATAPGVGVAATALAAQWLFSRAVPGAPFAPFSAASWLIRHVPGTLATEAIERWGHNATRILEMAAVMTALVAGAIVGARRPVIAAATAIVLTLAAAAIDPLDPAPLASLGSAFVAAASALAAAAIFGAGATSLRPFQPGRRRLLTGVALALGLASVGGITLLRSARRVATGLVRGDHVADVPSDPSFTSLPGLSAAITSRGDHYVVAIDLTYPPLSEDYWELRVEGAVERPVSFTLAGLRAMETFERPVLMCCISNPVGGRLVGGALWTSVPLSALLGRATPRPTARTVLMRSADGYTETLPLDLAMTDPVQVAFGMNGALLPIEHGFPARMLVPGRYGMRGAKWLEEIVLLEDDDEGYWERRGWDREAIVRTQSRIDVPADGATVGSPFIAAGIAWAGDRRISAVEVSADDGATWQPAELEEELGPLAWRRWKATVALRPGLYPLTVRARDGRGEPQDATRQPAHPAGATGFDRIVVTVGRSSADG